VLEISRVKVCSADIPPVCANATCNVGVLCLEAETTFFVKNSGHFCFLELKQFLWSMHSTCHSQIPSELTVAKKNAL